MGEGLTIQGKWFTIAERFGRFQENIGRLSVDSQEWVWGGGRFRRFGGGLVVDYGYHLTISRFHPKIV
jgi:hypothetical protein